MTVRLQSMVEAFLFWPKLLSGHSRSGRSTGPGLDKRATSSMMRMHAQTESEIIMQVAGSTMSKMGGGCAPPRPPWITTVKISLHYDNSTNVHIGLIQQAEITLSVRLYTLSIFFRGSKCSGHGRYSRYSSYATVYIR